MTTAIAKMVSKKILGETMANNFGKEDPYFETVPATRLDGTPSTKKTKKRRKALPPGISEQDGKVLTKVKRRAYRLDNSLFNCCGIRFGWSSVIGIIPVIGDALDCFMALMVLRTCQQVEGGLPREVQAKMMFNIIFDFGIGLVPFLGDLADAMFRANTRNAVVLEKYLRQKGARTLEEHGHRRGSDPSDPDGFDARVIREESPPPQYTEQPSSRHGNGNGSSVTQQQKAPETKKGGWFGFGRKQKQADVELGHHRQEMRRQQNLQNAPNEGSRRDRY